MFSAHSGSLRLFRFSGIQVYVHWTWFAIALVRVPSLIGVDVTLPTAIAIYLTLFAIVLIHEFGHSLACRQTGGRTHDIVLWPFGRIAYVRRPRPGATLWSIAAGPLVNVVLVPVLAALAWASSAAGFTNQVAGLAAYWRVVQVINISLLVFNLIPVYPLDGGQILQSLLWFLVGRTRSLHVVSVFGLIGVAAFGVWALVERDFWLGFIALFLGQRCWMGLQQAKAMAALQRLPRHSGFTCPTCHIAPPGWPALVVCQMPESL